MKSLSSLIKVTEVSPQGSRTQKRVRSPVSHYEPSRHMMLEKRQISVNETSRRCYDVDTTTRRHIPTGMKQRDMKPLTKILIIVCFFFLVCTLPICVFVVLERLVPDTNKPRDLAFRRLIWAVVALVLYCNNAFNFVIYCLSSRIFRNELAEMFSDVRLAISKKFNSEVVSLSSQRQVSREQPI